MGNSEIPRRVSKYNQPSRYARNSYSLDQNEMLSQQMSQVEIRSRSIKPREAVSSVPGSNTVFIQPQPLQSVQPKQSVQISPEVVMKKTYSLSLAKTKQKVELASKLTKLNQKNDGLRKQLIRINSELTEQLRRKKFSLRREQAQVIKHEDGNLMAVRRELQNGYKEIARLKRYIQNLKKNEGNAKNEDLTNQIEAKINSVEFDISLIKFEIDNAREVEKDILLQLKESEGIADFKELELFKVEIERLRKQSKKLVKNERVRLQKEKIMQEYMFQLERRKREIYGQYLPEIKSYANKNYQPDIKYQKKRSQEFVNYKPGGWQVRDVQEELKTLKEKHEEFHVKMDKALKAKNTAREESQKVKQDLEAAAKELETLAYKKERYMQLVMGNIQFLMNEADNDSDGLENSGQSVGGAVKTITKGSDLPDQVLFDDHNLIKNIDYKNVKIVSVNLWYTSKRQISILQMVYSNGKDCFLGGRSAQLTEQLQREVLSVQEGDYIKNIMGIFSKKGAIQFLAFYSAKGKAGQFGKQMMNGLNFTLGLSKSQRPVCISGYTFFDGSNWRINKLMVDVVVES